MIKTAAMPWGIALALDCLGGQRSPFNVAAMPLGHGKFLASQMSFTPFIDLVSGCHRLYALLKSSGCDSGSVLYVPTHG